MRIRTHQFGALAEEAIANRSLQSSLERLGVGFKAKRDLAFSYLHDPEDLRERGRRIKEAAIANLPQLLESLEARVQEAGGAVHWASSARAARSIVGELARTRGVRTVVKGKSMITEEIDLNEDLINQGIDVWETDLAEFIIQLAEEPPSHIVVPAVHKRKEEIAALFAEKLGVRPAETPEELTAIARQNLRERFLSADMGITGANMAVAETGTIVVVENEGNIRLSTTVPRIHVAVMGIEKVIPTLEDLSVLLNLLARSATGQNLSVYTSLLTGPRREGETDGPREFHLVLVDNGRTRILADPDRRETLYCIRCGACLNVCPVYLKAGGHSYGWVYPGPIGSVLTPQLLPPRIARSLPFASTLCGACAETCPVKIDLPKLLLTLRWRLVEDPNWDGGVSLGRRLGLVLFGWLAAHPAAYKSVARGVERLAPILSRSGDRMVLLPSLARWGRRRTLPAFAEPFSRRWHALRRQGQDGKAGS